MAIEIYFDGYCPESLLEGQQVEMRLNRDDFWESEATGLQIAVFPPFAAILRWRGKSQFRKSSDVASNSLTGLVLTAARTQEGEEFLPDEENIISSSSDLRWYLDEISKSKEAFDAAIFNPNDPAFQMQEQYLATLSPGDFAELFNLYDLLEKEDKEQDIMENEIFRQLHKKLYDLKLIFSFDWGSWQSGRRNISKPEFDYARCSILELCMYLTTIFRQDRFCSGTINISYQNGTLSNIFMSLKGKVLN